jgi:voltage-gated potassium channel
MREFGQILKDRGMLRIALLLLILLISAASVVYYFEHKTNPAFSTWLDAWWWSIVTFSTVGYGDITPTTEIGRYLTSLFILAGIITVSLFTATISSFYVSKVIQEGKGLSQIKSSQHTIILGWNSAGVKIVENLVLTDKDIELVMVNQLPEENVNEILTSFKANLRFVRGDYTRESILARANTSAAKAVIIIPDYYSGQPETNSEDKLLLAVLTVKGISKKVNVTVYSPNIENRPHLKRAGADAVITPENWIAAAVSAQVVSPGINELIQRLLFNPAEFRLRQVRIPDNLHGKAYSQIENHYMRNQQLFLGAIKEEKNIHIEDILSDDSSYLDEFIRKKFSDAGRLNIRDNNIETCILPNRDNCMKDAEFAIIVERV